MILKKRGGGKTKMRLKTMMELKEGVLDVLEYAYAVYNKMAY